MIPKLIYDFSASNLLDILLFTGVGFLLFVFLRELITWYWKINRIVELLEKIEENTSHKEIGFTQKNREETNTNA